MASLRHMPPPGGDKASGLDGDLQGRRIREDGTPEQVFSHPKDERTREFLTRFLGKE